jgi:hypothetical protein
MTRIFRAEERRQAPILPTEPNRKEGDAARKYRQRSGE